VAADMVTKVLCVAEKPSIAKAVANHLAGGAVNTASTTNLHWIQTNGQYTDASFSAVSLATSSPRTTNFIMTSQHGASAM